MSIAELDFRCERCEATRTSCKGREKEETGSSWEINKHKLSWFGRRLPRRLFLTLMGLRGNLIVLSYECVLVLAPDSGLETQLESYSMSPESTVVLPVVQQRVIQNVQPWRANGARLAMSFKGDGCIVARAYHKEYVLIARNIQLILLEEFYCQGSIFTTVENLAMVFPWETFGERETTWATNIPNNLAKEKREPMWDTASVWNHFIAKRYFSIRRIYFQRSKKFARLEVLRIYNTGSMRWKRRTKILDEYIPR